MKYLILCVLLLSSCATTHNFDKNMKTWVGGSEANLVKAWGPPGSVYPLDGGAKVLTWNRAGATFYQRSFSGVSSTSTGCKVDMTINASHLVEGYRFEGNDCNAEASWREEERQKDLERRRREYGADSI
jgi:hypothetical protein